MKRIALIVLITACAAGFAFAQELKLSGEVKTGVYWQEVQDEGKGADTKVSLMSKDDAGSGQGRYRLNLDYDNSKGFGMSARIQWENWGEQTPNAWQYAYGWGSFFEDNLKVSIGRLGGSPWGSGGPEKWAELEQGTFGGMRVEYKPSWVPENVGKFNVGFVLSWFNDPREDGKPDGTEPSMADLLSESVIGFSWTHDLFHVRFAVRLDSEYDRTRTGVTANGTEGVKMVYRVEEHMLKNLLPGMDIWALGVLTGVGATDIQTVDLSNWLFIQYAPPQFTAQVRLGYDLAGMTDETDKTKGLGGRSVLHVKPTFYWNFFDGLISAGASFWFGQDYGEGQMFEGSPWAWLELEPKLQINFTSSYIAFAYNWRREYIHSYPEVEKIHKDPIRQTQWMNLRFCIYF